VKGDLTKVASGFALTLLESSELAIFVFSVDHKLFEARKVLQGLRLVVLVLPEHCGARPDLVEVGLKYLHVAVFGLREPLGVGGKWHRLVNELHDDGVLRSVHLPDKMLRDSHELCHH